jgi:hypothetical protein
MEYLTISHCLTAPPKYKPQRRNIRESKMKFGGTQRKQRSMLNVLKKPFIHVLSDLKQDHTVLPCNK